MEPAEILDMHNRSDFTSRLGYARWLHENYPNRSVKSWEMLVLQSEHEQAVPYTYDESEDTYYLEFDSHSTSLSGEDHRWLVRNYTGGHGVKYLANRMGTTQEFIRRWRRTFGVTRGSSPITVEEAIVTGEDELAEVIVSRKMHRAEVKAAGIQQKQIEADAQKWRTLEAVTLTHLKGQLEKAPKTVPRLKLKKTSKPYALVVCPTDFHWGKYGWVDEVGESYNFEEARTRLFEKTQSLIERIPVAPEKVYVGAGSDWFHVDNDSGTTTRGTPQDMCASPAEILITGCKLAREHIDLLRQIAPIEVVMMAGNHDRHSTIALMMYLSAAYEGVDDVKITITSNNRRYLTYGDTLLGFTHGDGLSRKTNLAGLMAVEAREQWGLTKHKVWFHGHLHHQRLTEGDGCLVVQMPSLAGHDRYHARSGYTTSTAGLAAYFIDKDEGYIGSLFAPVTHED